MKLRVLYCDDNEEYLGEFVKRHAADFDVETLSSIESVYGNVTSRRDPELPDVLLLDLYHPCLPGEKTPEEQAAHDLAEEKLASLREMIGEVRECVNKAWSPAAIDVLQELRRHYPAHKLPIMIYTQRGLLLLDDDEIRKIEQAGAEWLLKDPERISSATEGMRIRRFVAQSEASGKLPRDLKLTILSAVTSAALGVIITLLVT